MFAKKGYIVVEKAAADEEKLLNVALEAGADDMRDDGDNWEIICDPSAFEAVRDAVKALGVEPASAQVAMLPQNYVKLEGKEATQMVQADGRARRSRRRQAGLVELRHRGEGDRGLAGVRVFGIDPGSERTGYGCVDSDGRRHHLVRCGAIDRAGAGASFPEQLVAIHRELVALLGECRPDCVAIENLFYATNVRSALKLGHARGVAMLAAVECGRRRWSNTRPPRSSAPWSATAAPRSPRCGRWSSCCSASTPCRTPHDAADALAVAICHVHQAGAVGRVVARGGAARRASRAAPLAAQLAPVPSRGPA